MPNALPLGTIVRVRVGCDQTGQTALNRGYMICTTAVGLGGDDTALATQLDTLFSTLYQALLANDARYVGVGVQIVNSLGQPLKAETVSTAGIGPGTAGAISLPLQVSGLIQRKSATPGRVGRGRVYVPFPAAADNFGDGGPTVGYVANLAALAAAWAASQLVGGGGNTSNMVWEMQPRLLATYIPITACVAEAAWATQRRRGFFGQRNRPPFS